MGQLQNMLYLFLKSKFHSFYVRKVSFSQFKLNCLNTFLCRFRLGIDILIAVFSMFSLEYSQSVSHVSSLNKIAVWWGRGDPFCELLVLFSKCWRLVGCWRRLIPWLWHVLVRNTISLHFPSVPWWAPRKRRWSKSIWLPRRYYWEDERKPSRGKLVLLS